MEITKNKRKALLISLTCITVMAAVLSVAFFTQANNQNRYVIDILDQGTNSTKANQEMQIEQKIVPAESNDKELVYTINAKSLIQKKPNTEVAIAIDNSFSMQENSDVNAVKTKIKQVAQTILTNVPNTKVSMSDNSGLKIALVNNTTSNINSINTAVNGITFGNGNYLGSAIDFANSSFSGNGNTERYIIVLTDATDSVKDKLINVTDNNINVISILYDITNNEVGTPTDPKYGSVYMFADLNEQKDLNKIINDLNKSINNVTIENTLTNDILTYFNVEILSQQVDGQTITKTANGITWTIDALKANETLQLKYKIKLKDDVAIDKNVIYKTLNSSEKVKAIYKMYGVSKELPIEKADTPKFIICQTYTMKIKAVNSENTSLQVEGIGFKVVGKNEAGDIVYTGTHTTARDGYIKIEKLRTLGKVTYEITPIVNKVGYDSQTVGSLAEVTNDYHGVGLTLQTDLPHAEPSQTERIVEMQFPIKVQEFTLKICLTDLNNSNVKLGGTEFRLIQPRVNNKYEMDVLFATTDANGELTFNPAVMPVDGTYDYILSQMTTPQGFESMGNATLRITFRSGKVSGEPRVVYNNNIEVKRYSDYYVELGVGNKSLLEDSFNLVLNLNDEDTNAPIIGGKYTIKVKPQGNSQPYVFGGNVTDDKGQIKLKLPGSGYITIAIVEEAPATGYSAQTQAKEFYIYRKDGQVQRDGGWNSNTFRTEAHPSDNEEEVWIKAKLKQERNIVRVKAVDLDGSIDAPLENVEFLLKNTVTGKTYGPAITNAEGMIDFIVDDEAEGRYKYELTAVSIPYGYVCSTNPANINVRFDKNKYICEIDDTSNVKKQEYQLIEDSYTKLHTAYVEIAFNIDGGLAHFFEIDLSDIDTGAKIEGAEYEVAITAGDFTKTFTRATDANGKISTRMAIDKTKINEVSIIVEEKKAKRGYKIDSGVQELTLILSTGQIIHSPAEVMPNSGAAGQVRYAQKTNDNTIVYHHTNRKKDASDVLLNVNITTLDKQTLAPIGAKTVQISSSPISLGDEENVGDAEIFDPEGETLNLTGITSADLVDTGKLSFKNLKVVGINPEGSQGFELNLVVDGNLIKMRCIFAYNEYTDTIDLVTAESIWGNVLIRQEGKTFTTTETQDGYLSDLNLEIYTNYNTNTGNLSLNLQKFDLENPDTFLYGALYDVIIERPDGTKIVKQNVEIKDNEIELDGIYIPLGTSIYITETTPPVGFDANETITLKATNVDIYTNEVTLTMENGNYQTSRSQLEQGSSISGSDGTVQSVYELKMYDVQQDRFKVKIKTQYNTINEETKQEEAVQSEGFTFEITNNKGAQRKTEGTNSQGEVITAVGGIYDAETSPVVYTVTGIKSGRYYKKLTTPINVNVWFKDDGTVDVAKTMEGQTDSNYELESKTPGKWYFEGLNNVNSNGDIIYDIGLVMNVEPLDKLKVEIETVNKFTGEVLASDHIKYAITPSVKEAKGASQLEVCYTETNASREYTLRIVELQDNYVFTPDMKFNIVYNDDACIMANPKTASENLEILGTYDGTTQTIKLRVKVEPKVSMVINNQYYFDHSAPIQGSEFVISQQNMIGMITTDSVGKGKTYVGAYGSAPEKPEIYMVSQTKAQEGYATLDPFEVKVYYNENKTITNVELVDQDLSKFVQVGFIVPSQETDYGYNECPNGIITITALNYPAVTFNITNINRQNSNSLSGTHYSITSTINTIGQGITGADGIAKTYVDRSAFEKTVTYTITETVPSFGYQTFGTPITVNVDFDENGYIKVGSAIITNNPNIDVIAKVSTQDTRTTPKDNFVVNLELKNNPLLKFNITKVNREDETQVIRDVTFELTGVYEDTEYAKYTGITDVNGQTTLNVDRTLDSQKMVYTIKETKKSPSYEWLDEDIKLEITYDATGKMVPRSLNILQGHADIDILNQDADNWQVDMKIKNDEIKAFGIHLYTDDKQDNTKKVETAKWNAWLTSTEQTGHVEDKKYSVELKSGRTETLEGEKPVYGNNGDLQPIIGHGEDHRIVGQYSEGAGKRTLRLTTTQQSFPTTYYKDGKTISSAYSLDQNNILIDLEFDDEGRIVGQPKLRTPADYGYNIEYGERWRPDPYIGWILDEKYVEVSKEGNYGISVTIHYYPLLEFSIQAKDMYTKENLSAKYSLRTYMSGLSYAGTVKEGDIPSKYDRWRTGISINNYNEYRRNFCNNITPH